MPDAETPAEVPGDEQLDSEGPAAPEDCAAPADACAKAPGALDQPPEGTGFTVHDEVAEAFRFESTPMMMDPDDGMIRPIDPPMETRFAPPFTRENLVCIEDNTDHVEVFAEELLAQGWRPCIFWNLWKWLQRLVGLKGLSQINRHHFTWFRGRTGRCALARPAFGRHGTKTSRCSPEELKVRFGAAVDVAARPRRERCRYYYRQLFNIDGQNPDEPGGKVMFRRCAACRSIGGAFMSLDNQAVYACDLRNPPDEPTAERWLDVPDCKKLAEQPHLTLVPLFGMKGQDIRLEEAADDRPSDRQKR